MSSKFVTNQDKLLSDVVNNTIPSSENLYFLVGYFYFSGFSEIYQQIKDKKVKILIGLEIERSLNNRLAEFYQLQENPSQNSSNLAKKDNFYDSLVDLINETDFCDTPQKREAFRVFLEKINNGSLEVRKTKESNHAKLYIFEKKQENSEGGQYPGTVITGSSNLTRSGLKDRFEVNVVSREKDDYDASKEIFDQLWKKSVPVADQETIEEFNKKVTQKVYIDKVFSPYLFYARVLMEYFSTEEKEIYWPGDITRDKYFNLKYQTDAIRDSLDYITRHNGAIIADVVGLGKSIVASAVAYNLNLETVIFAPRHLRGQWEAYKRDFKFRGKIYNSGSIHKALEDYEDHLEEKLIIVDEAHKYRNEFTQDYKRLHQLCQGNKVILLTATPFNNKPQDIFSMIKLFQIPARSTIRTVENLSSEFKKLIKEYKNLKKIEDKQKQKQEVENIAERIRGLLTPLVIRRSRLDLQKIEEYKKDLESQNIEFPTVNPPKILEYSLGEVQDKYISTLEKIMQEDEGFIGARYKPVYYLKNREKYQNEIAKIFGDVALFKQGQKNLADFMKKLLVHRFESSIYAFGSTLDKMINSMEKVKEWHNKKGKIPIHKKGEIPDVKFLEDSVKNIEEELNNLQESKNMWFVDSSEVRKQFMKGLENDQALLREIRRDWFGEKKLTFDLGHDPKIEHFKEKIREEFDKYPDRKIVVFSEYADTVNYVFKKIKNDFKVFSYTAQHASDQNKKIIQENFDASVSPNKQKNDYDVLIATDAISEGYNLHRAGTVVNYDIPYNPTRVVQRVGRINRVSQKVFDELFIYNFFPSLTGEEETCIKKVTTLKIDMINALLGSDTRVLTEEEELESFYKEAYEQANKGDGEESWDTDFKNEYNALTSSTKKEAEEIPKRSRIRRTESKDKDYQGVVMFAKKGDDYVFKFGSNSEEVFSLTPQEALRLFKADRKEEGQRVSEDFEEIYQNLKNKMFQYSLDRYKDKTDQETVNTIKLLLESIPEENEYLEDLLTVVFELEALNDKDKKFIRALDISNDKSENLKKTEKLKQEIPTSYLKKIIQKAESIEEGKESLLLVEELI